MRVTYVVMFLALTAFQAKADKCDPLAPTNAQNIDESFKGKIEGEIKGLLSNLAGGSAGIEGAYRKIETDELQHYPDSNKLYVWQRIIYLACINPETKIDLNELFKMYLNGPSAQGSSPTLSYARLVFDHIEPYPQTFVPTGGTANMTFMTFKVWFKNVGQSAAQNPTYTAIPFPRETALSVEEESNIFASMKNTSEQFKLTLNDTDIQPGQLRYFLNGGGVSNEVWSDFNRSNGDKKLLYIMAMLTYGSDNLDERTKIVTETCVVYMNGNISNWFDCKSGHNRVYRLSE
jgi:hypothetical protein